MPSQYICKHKRKHISTIDFNCKQCGVDFVRPSCWSKATKFCSMKCSGAYMSNHLSGNKSPNFKHGVTSNGYRRIGAKRQLEHRIIMEKTLGRKLEKNEWVHHINGDKLDNRTENLIVVLPETHFSDIHCPNCKYHFLIK